MAGSSSANETLGELAATDVPPLGPFRTFQVPVRHVAELTGLDLGALVEAQRVPPGRSIRAEGRNDWRKLSTLEDAAVL